MFPLFSFSFFFFFNDTATTEIYTLSLHDALPILDGRAPIRRLDLRARPKRARLPHVPAGFEQPDRKSTRLNSSHQIISYAVFCLKKKKKKTKNKRHTIPATATRTTCTTTKKKYDC